MTAERNLCGKSGRGVHSGGKLRLKIGKIYHKPLFPETQEESGNFSEFFRYVQLLCILYYVNYRNKMPRFGVQTQHLVSKKAAASKC